MEIKIIKNFMYKLSLSTFNLIIPILITPVLYRRLGPTSIGEIEYSNVIYNYFFIFASFGIYNYGLKKISKIKNDEEKVNKLYSELFIINFLSNIIIFLIYIGFIYKYYLEKKEFIILLILSGGIISNIFYIEWVNEAFENYKFITKKTLITRILMLLVMVIFIKTENDTKKYVFFLILFNFINNILSYFYIKRRIKLKLKYLNLKKHLKSLMAILIMVNVNVLYTQLDRTMLGRYSTLKEVAYYAIGQKIVGIFLVLIMSYISVSTSQLSFYKKNDYFKYKELLKSIYQNTLFFSIPIIFGIISLSEYIVTIFGGEEFIPATIVLQIFSFRLLINIIDSTINSRILFLDNKEVVSVKFYFIFGVFNFIFNFIFINHLSAINSILITLVCEILLVISQMYYLKRKYTELYLIIKSKKIIYYILGSIGFFIIKYIIELAVYLSPIFKIILIILFSILYYNIFLYLIKDQFYYTVLKQIKEKIRAKRLR